MQCNAGECMPQDHVYAIWRADVYAPPLHPFISTPWRRYQWVWHLNLKLPRREKGQKKQRQLEFLQVGEQGNDQNVNGDMAMNTDRVQLAI